MNLAEVRKRINVIDDQLLELFGERLECSKQVAEVKLESQDQVFKPAREKEICDKFIREGNLPGLSIIKNIMRNSRRYQYGIFASEGKEHKAFLDWLDDEKKLVFEKGGSLSLVLEADSSAENGLTANDIILVAAETGLQIDSIVSRDNIVGIKLTVGAEERSRKNAYILTYMLFQETMHNM